MQDFFYTFLWIVVYAMPSFVIQLILCFKVKNKFIRNIPLYITGVGVLLTVDVYFNFSGIHSGWRELAAFFTGFYTAIFALGIVAAFMVHKIYIKTKRKKR